MRTNRRVTTEVVRPERVRPLPHRPSSVALERVAGTWEFGGVQRDLKTLAGRLSADGRTLSYQALAELDLEALGEQEAAGVELLKAAYFPPQLWTDEFV